MTQPSIRLVACLGGMVTMGGLERTMFEVLGAVSSRGGRVHCILSSWASDRMAPAVERLGASWSTGSYRERLERRPGIVGGLKLGADVVRTSAGLLKDARRVRPTHVLLPEFGAAIRNWPALLWLRVRGTAVVLAVRNAPATGGFYRALWRWVVSPVVSTFVCASEATRRQVVSHGITPGRTVVAGSAVSLAYEPARDVSRDLLRVVYVGQLIPEKGLDLLLDALAIVRSRGLDATLEVIGDVDGWVAPTYAGYQEQVRRRAEQPDLRGAVTFVGWRDDVLDRLAAAGVHCCPSRPEMHEGLPRVVIEAKVAGVPSVAFCHGPFPELIETGHTGWLADGLSAEALADQLEQALGNPGTLLALAPAVRASAQRFDPDAFQERWWNLLSGDGRSDVPPQPGDPIAPDRQSA